MCRKEQIAFQTLKISPVMIDLMHFANLVAYHRYFHILYSILPVLLLEMLQKIV